MTTTHTAPPSPPPASASGAESTEWLDISRRPRSDTPLVRRAREHGPLAALLTGTALLYLIGLSASGWANQYYSAAVQAGTKSWKAFLFGSLDSSNFITVDKPPASLWVMELSARIFGVNSWSILVPQALEGVAAVAILYVTVKRIATPSAALFAGAILATTPIATLMFRFNNPDALLVLLTTAAAYATVRAIEGAKGKWLALAGVLLGFAFLTKMLQGFLVVPAFALAYLVAAPTPLRKRLLHLLGAGAAMFAAAGWWVALVELWPAGSRPYIGGSTNNSVLELVFGYNGIGRLTGSDNNGNVSGGGGGFSSGDIGLTRLFGTDMGTQISWLLPAALIGIVAVGWVTWRQPRTNLLRAGMIVFGGWVLCTGIVLSYASGIIHPYYTVALAPGIAGTVALAVSALWAVRDKLIARVFLAAVVAAGAIWSFELLGRAADWNPWLRWAVLILGVASVALVLVPRVRAWIVAPVLAITLLIAPTAYSLQTASTAHTGALPTAGPTTTSGFGGGGAPRGGFPGGGQGGFTGGFPGGPPGSTTNGSTNGSTTNGSTNGSTTNGSTNGGPPATGGGFPGGSTNGTTNGGPPSTGGGGAGGLGGASTVDSDLQAALEKNASDYEWVAATVSANSSASLQLATGDAVMALGGFNGTDNAITLAQFKALVAAGKIHYFVANGNFIGSTAANTSTTYAIQQWIERTFTAQTIGNTTVYDLTASS